MVSPRISRVLTELTTVCRRWPVDPSKKGRDFGEHLHNYASKLEASNPAVEKEAELTLQLDAVRKMSSDHYRKKYKRQNEIAYTKNLTGSKEVLSNAGQKYFRSSESRGFWARFTRQKSITELVEESKKS